MNATNSYITFRTFVATSPSGNMLFGTTLYLSEDNGADVVIGDVVSDSDYQEYRVFNVVSKISTQQFEVIIEDIRNSKKTPTDGVGLVYTPTEKWGMARVSTSTAPDQFKAVYDETNTEIIDQNLGGHKENVILYTISSDDVAQGFIDISNIAPTPAEVGSIRMSVVGGIEQVNADTSFSGWGLNPDFQVRLTSTWKRIIFKNYGQPTVPLSGQLDLDDTIQMTYLYKA